MACMKSVNRLAKVALSPDAPYLAAGTVDHALSTPAHIEIFNLDLESDDTELALVGGSTSWERFTRLSWAGIGSNSEEFSLGLIAGGLHNGTIGIWNPRAIIGAALGLGRHSPVASIASHGDDSPPKTGLRNRRTPSTRRPPPLPEVGVNPLVGRLVRHNGHVRGLEFNPFTPHILASGADDGKICIWDLAEPAEPAFYTRGGNGSCAQTEISYLSWNSKTRHVLASASYNGTVVVRDIKQRAPVVSLLEPNGRRCSVLQWNPDSTTQLAVASDDDDSPTISCGT